MRISELSARSGVPVPTLKFYLREGLLPPGMPTAPNQAEYSEVHLRRLRLIRVLTEIGGVRLRTVREILDAVDDERLPTHRLLGVAHHALGPVEDESDSTPAVAAARSEVDRFIAGLGWEVSPDAPARRTLARALAALRSMGDDVDVRVFAPYARAADRIAAREVATVRRAASRMDAVESVVTGTLVFESALVALRRLAQEHHSARRFASEPRGRRHR